MAYVLTSLSGNLISAASAGYAPTNSGDVSAIASAYQVVSATATQLYAGTAYVTSINSAPVSAARAGNAVNATQATSAWYDGTGRLISSLPDSAAVSAIASAYAESAASSKQDTLTFGYDADDKISSIDGSALAGEGGGGLVTAIGTSENGIVSINNSGLVDTAALRSADYSSLYVQEPLYISASGDSSYIGISGDIGGIDSATCSAIASAYAESAVSSKADESALSGYYTTANESGFITGIDLSDYATTAYVDSSISSFVDSAYVESAVSGKLDATAFNSGDFYTTANESGYVDSAYVDSAVSSKADSSALSSYALSADVSGTVDLVSTQSANWGGSALALSAGPGVKFEKSGNVLVASTDETLLWENTGGQLTMNLTFPLSLSETITNFERVKFLYGGDSYMENAHWFEFEATDNNPYTLYDFRCDGPASTDIFWRLAKFNISGTSVTNTYNSTINLNTSFAGNGYNSVGFNYLVKIVGINRTAEA